MVVPLYPLYRIETWSGLQTIKKGAKMPLVKWDDSFKMDIYEIDVQHKKLIDLVNILHEAMKAGKSNDVLDSAINALLAYTQLHFHAEERMLQQNNYFDLTHHKIQHQKFIARIKQFRDQFESGQFSLSIDMLMFLSDWLTNHIKKTDVLYAKELNSILTH